MADALQTVRIGILLIHGIGDQNRYDHLQNVATEVVKSLSSMHTLKNVSVSIPGLSGAPLTILAHINGGLYQMDLDEVWWRDLGQRLTAMAYFRFWLWAASLGGTSGFFANPSPETGYDSATDHTKLTWLQRAKLFFQVTYIFVLLAPLALVLDFLILSPEFAGSHLFILSSLISVQFRCIRKGASFNGVHWPTMISPDV